ncbi:hypothetical protein SAMN04487894_12723 [Niabella drilacis]|uniref:Uncharacterized protein n=1 Tax=Niabella drilacis (strain DSM 25811 / CCM 8410 / CCUG 62505 / LMG 26954 / E90) TaxID=1285928 RepID=A0A1G7B4W1_NIADE|nr:hypothetical protein SAMN04487894_12723 [Niabella drilacis]
MFFTDTISKSLKSFVTGYLRACLNFIDGIYYEAILERNKENFAGMVGHYGEKFNAVAAQNSHNKATE